MGKIALVSRYIRNENNAVQKAPMDIDRIFVKHCGNSIYRPYTTNKKYLKSIQCMLRYNLYKLILKSYDYILFQWPMYLPRPVHSTSFCKSAKKSIVLIHDLDSLRFSPDDMSKIKKEIEDLNKFDMVISHNTHMSKWLKDNGLQSPIIELNVFDYLTNFCPNEEQCLDKYSICFAGNLSKSVFLKDYSTVVKTKTILYGNEPMFELSDSMEYRGSFSPDELCQNLQGSFGLIWDGEDTTYCSGKNGNYMKYNNPHKMSLYLVCGLPIIVWKEAAIADFIIENKIGITVGNLSEIDSIIEKISCEEYVLMRNNAVKLSKKISSGFFTKKVLTKAVSILREK